MQFEDIPKMLIHKSYNNIYILMVNNWEVNFKDLAYCLVMTYVKLKNYLLKNFECKIRDEYRSYISTESKEEMEKILEYIQMLYMEVLLAGKENIKATRDKNKQKNAQLRLNKKIKELEKQQQELIPYFSNFIGKIITIPIAIHTNCMTPVITNIQFTITGYKSEINYEDIYLIFETDKGELHFFYKNIEIVDNVLTIKYSKQEHINCHGNIIMNFN